MSFFKYRTFEFAFYYTSNIMCKNLSNCVFSLYYFLLQKNLPFCHTQNADNIVPRLLTTDRTYIYLNIL